MAEDINKVEIEQEKVKAAAEAEKAETAETESEISDAGEKAADEENASSSENDCKNTADIDEEKTDESDAAADGKSDKAEDSKDKRSDKKDQKITELNDKYVRLFAEFDNFRKRSESEKSGMFAEGERTVLLKILPLIDNFERALNTIPESEKDTAFAEGIEKVYRAFTDQLKSLGVTEIEAVGREFDANLHNAVMHIEDEAQGENIIVEEFQKGYMFQDKVLRYSMVKVAN